jgi:hypothetical protein
MLKNYTKADLKNMKPFIGTGAVASMNVVQNVEVLSAGMNLIKVIASAPGSVGYGANGVTFHYTAASHMTHELDPNAYVDLNHHPDEKIGHLTASESDHMGNLITSMKIDPQYDFFTPIIKDNRHDGVSIETQVKDGHWIDDKNVLVNSYILSGIAVLFSKPPACDKDICHVLSHDASVKEHGENHELLAEIDAMDEEHLKESYKNVVTELAARNSSASQSTA